MSNDNLETRTIQPERDIEEAVQAECDLAARNGRDMSLAQAEELVRARNALWEEKYKEVYDPAHRRHYELGTAERMPADYAWNYAEEQAEKEATREADEATAEFTRQYYGE